MQYTTEFPGLETVLLLLLRYLKHKAFPLADILDVLLDLGTWGMGVPIEIEFAVNMQSWACQAERICYAADASSCNQSRN